MRQKFKANSRFFFGKNNVMAVALGRDTNTEYANQLSKVSRSSFFDPITLPSIGAISRYY